MTNFERIMTEVVIPKLVADTGYNLSMYICEAYDECSLCPIRYECHGMTESEINDALREEVDVCAGREQETETD